MDWGSFVFLSALLAICISPVRSELSQGCLDSQSLLICLLALDSCLLSEFLVFAGALNDTQRDVMSSKSGVRIDFCLFFADQRSILSCGAALDSRLRRVRLLFLFPFSTDCLFPRSPATMDASYWITQVIAL